MMENDSTTEESSTGRLKVLMMVALARSLRQSAHAGNDVLILERLQALWSELGPEDRVRALAEIGPTANRR